MSEQPKTQKELDQERKAELTKMKAALANKKKRVSKRKNAKISDRSAARTSRMKPEERESLRRRLVEHYGASVMDKALSNCGNIQDQQTILVEFRYRMEREIEAQQKEVSDYYEEIDKEYRKVGRPKSVFNWREMEYLCSIGCTLQEIAGFFQVAESTVMDRIKDEFGISFNAYYEKHSQGIKVALRRRQIRLAMDGDGAMLKFLGKNILGQKEKMEFDGAIKVNSWVDLITNLENGNASEITGESKDKEKE